MNMPYPPGFLPVSANDFDRIVNSLDYVRTVFENVTLYRQTHGDTQVFGYMLSGGDCFLHPTLLPCQKVTA